MFGDEKCIENYVWYCGEYVRIIVDHYDSAISTVIPNILVIYLNDEPN
jgi:hypothetical protein